MGVLLDELRTLEQRGLRRRMRAIEGAQAAELVVDGRPVINFSSNNYLGLADHPRLIAAAQAAMVREGFGAGASRLIAGNLAAHRRLEARIARFKRTEAALVFNSGYHANVGVLSALAGPEDVIFSDALNHASIIDGARLSRAKVQVYPHRDLVGLAQALRGSAVYRRRVIVTDTVFSMDGDAAPLPELLALARAHQAFLIVDEAHAVGVCGDGRGLARDLDVDLHIGTLGKALGCFGAYAAGSQEMIDYLMQRARSFIFTTALPVPVVAAAEAAIDWLDSPEGEARRARLRVVSEQFQRGLVALGFPAPPVPSHIVPLRIGEPLATMQVCEALLERGIYAQGIRPPTVAEGTSRLRFALMATHTDEHLRRVLEALGELHAGGMIPP